MILGYDSVTSSLLTSNDIGQANSLSLKEGIDYDELHVKKGVVAEPDNNRENWGVNTTILARFNNSLESGSLEMGGMQVEKIRIKRRDVDGGEFMTVAEFPYTKDIPHIIYTDKTAAPLRKYQYAIVPVSGKVEGTHTTGTIYAQLNSAVISDADKRYVLEYGFQLRNVEYVIPNETIETISSERTPYVTYHGDLNYVKGSVSCILIADRDTAIDLVDEYKLRTKIMDFATNKKVKLLRTADGFNRLISITGSPSLSYEGTAGLYSLSFNFVEIGDVNSQRDLFENGFINVGDIV